MPNFIKDLKRGNKHMTEIAIPYFESRGWRVTISTLEQDKKGTDLVIARDDLTYRVQVKACERIHETQNIYLQDSKVIGNNSDIFFYMDVEQKIGYAIQTRQLKARWDKIVQNARKHSQWNPGYTTIGRIISIDKLSDIVTINQIKLNQRNRSDNYRKEKNETNRVTSADD